MSVNTPQTVQHSGLRKVGVVANEFFEPNFGGMGGYGWVAREAAVFLAEQGAARNGQLGDSALFLTGNDSPLPGKSEACCHGLPLVFNRSNDWRAYAKDVRSRGINVLLTIDYRPSYDFPLSALSEVPLLVWVQDPRPEEDIAKVNTLRIPGSNAKPQGIDPIDCKPLRDIARASEESRRPVLFASPAPGLLDKARQTYDINIQNMEFLPYLLDFDPGVIRKSQRPTVVYLGRLDPIKRPWVYVELAKHFPSVDFLMLGQAHFRGSGAWQPSCVPENVHLLGHLDGEAKRATMASAWVLVNTSIHEALPVSFLEALLFETPLVSCQNPESIVSRFGAYTGRWDGTGLEGVQAFAEGLSRLLDEPDRRVQMGKEGRVWAKENHGRLRFDSAFEHLYQAAQAKSVTVRQAPAVPSPAVSDVLPQPQGVAAWHFRRLQAMNEVGKVVPDGQEFILIDDNQLGIELIGNRHAIPFLEKDGRFFGSPSDSATALSELERMRQRGMRWLVITWPAFWWCEFYTEFLEQLKSSHRLIHQNENTLIFYIR